MENIMNQSGGIESREWLHAHRRRRFLFVFPSRLWSGTRVILVLTAGFGDGHNTAAASTAEALRRLSPGEDIQVQDLITEVQPRVAAALKQLYQQAITHFPTGWRMVYRLLEKSDVESQDAAWLAPLVRGLKKQMDHLRPRILVSTYPVYATLLDVLRKQMEVPPLATIITDSITVHRVWLTQGSELFCVADDETRHVVEMGGIQPEIIRVTGFPVSLRFTEPLAEAARPPGEQRILYLPSTPARRVGATLKALQPLLEAGARLTVPVGKHSSRLYHVLRKFNDSVKHLPPVEVIGWTDRMPELLRTHDVVICKAGGAILHEVLAAQIPAVIDYVVPGQEEGNAELLVSNDCAIRTATAAETGAAVRAILANGGERARHMRACMTAISVPDAALRAAREILALAPIPASP
jgi:processive 1,2-diacylglycerol beta-glucosyltransferase